MLYKTAVKLIVILFFGISISHNSLGQTTPESRLLSLGDSISSSISGGESHWFRFSVPAGFYARTEVEQQGVGISAALYAPDGDLVVEVEGPESRLWRETLSSIADKPGIFKIRISASGDAKSSGTYSIKLSENRLSVPDDQKWLLAEAAFASGRKLSKPGSGKLASSIDQYAVASKIWRELGEKEWEAITHLNLGWSYLELQRLPEADAALNQSFQLLREIKQPAKALLTMLSVGGFYEAAGRKQKVIEYSEQVLALSREHRFLEVEGAILSHLTGLYSQVGQEAKAMKTGEEAIKVLTGLTGQGAPWIFNRLGDSYFFVKQLEKARSHYLQAVDVSRKQGNRDQETHALFNLAYVYLEEKAEDKAIENFERTLQGLEHARDNATQIRLLLTLADTFYDRNQYEKAIVYGERALKVTRLALDRSGESSALVSLGDVYVRLNQHEKARGYYEQALAIRRTWKLRSEEGESLYKLGIIYSKLNQPERAIDFYKQALAIHREVVNRDDESETLHNLGISHADLNQLEKAKSYYEEALAIHRELGDVNGQGNTLNSLANIYFELKQPDKAVSMYEQALHLAREARNRYLESYPLKNLMYAWKELEKPHLSILYGKQTINVYQEIRENIKNLKKELQRSFVEDKTDEYRFLADVLISEGRFPEAQAVLDLLKEEEFANLAVRSGGNPGVSVPYNSAEDSAIKAVEKVASFSRELSELKGKANLTEAEKKRILEIEMVEIVAANEALAKALDALRKTAPSVEKLLADRRKENIQSVLPKLGENVVAIYTVVGTIGAARTKQSEIGWAMIVFPNGTSKAYPIDTADLNQTIWKFRLALENPNCDPEYAGCEIKKLGHEIYRKLFLQTSTKLQKTLAADLEEYFQNHETKVLMWSLDGVLRYIPMAALHDGNRFLLEKYTNVLFNTASLTSLADNERPEWRVLGLGVSDAATVVQSDGRAAKFGPLKQGELELKLLVRENKPEDTDGLFPGVLKLNSAFDKKALFEGMLDKPTLVHISSHFSYNPFDEKRSYLLIGNSGRLEISELDPFPNLFVGVDLLSLSACDTATGTSAEPISHSNNANGKDVEGLAYTAQMKGAETVMASLWKVSDTGTKELMLKFYELRKTRPELSKGETLRQAQLALLKGAHDPKGIPLNYPKFWAPFVLIGNWR